MIRIDHQQCDRGRFSPTAPPSLADFEIEATAVGETCQPIRRCQGAELLLCFSAPLEFAPEKHRHTDGKNRKQYHQRCDGPGVLPPSSVDLRQTLTYE